MKEVVHMKAVAPLAVEYKKAGAEMKAPVHKTVVVHIAAVVKTFGYSCENLAVDIEQSLNQFQAFDYFTQV